MPAAFVTSAAVIGGAPAFVIARVLASPEGRQALHRVVEAYGGSVELAGEVERAVRALERAAEPDRNETTKCADLQERNNETTDAAMQAQSTSMNVEEVAARIDRHPRRVQQLVADGTLVGRKVGGRWQIPDVEVNRYLKEQTS